MDRKIRQKEINKLTLEKRKKLINIVREINSTENGKYFLDYLKSINEEAIYNFKISDNLLAFYKGISYFYMMGVKTFLDYK